MSEKTENNIEVPTQSVESPGVWLWLFAIGVVLSPILNFYHIKQLYNAIQNVNWDVIWQQSPMTVLSVIFEFGMQGYMLVFSLLLAAAFFGRNCKFSKMFIVYIVSLVCLGIINTAIIAAIPNVTTEQVVQARAFPISIFIIGLVWILYFLNSTNVKKIFVVGANK
ncbi:MAG TPA: DUF2569 family protein [Methylotenera sp.]|nr:DUF2569 family protein [Methylotenera sp.]HPV44110.1 DUF2569 family protein [Methylotenera sp.]